MSSLDESKYVRLVIPEMYDIYDTRLLVGIDLVMGLSKLAMDLSELVVMDLSSLFLSKLFLPLFESKMEINISDDDLLVENLLL